MRDSYLQAKKGTKPLARFVPDGGPFEQRSGPSGTFSGKGRQDSRGPGGAGRDGNAKEAVQRQKTQLGARVDGIQRIQYPV